jgi:hypothetical protein
VPSEWNSLFWTRDLDEAIQRWYHIEGDDYIVFQIRWEYFTEVAGIEGGSLLLMNPCSNLSTLSR